MKYLLDTNACVDYLNGRHPALVTRVQSESPDALCTSSVVAAELRFGADRSAHARRNHARIDDFLKDVKCVPFDADAARVFGKVRAALEARGTPIGPYDTMIAAHTLHLDLTLVTDNVAEFSRVGGLSIENWRKV